MLDAAMPLKMLTGAGAAVLVVHHCRKSGTDAIEGSRGSLALPGVCDILVHLEWSGKSNDTGRIITTRSRFHETPPQLTIALTEYGYRVVEPSEEAPTTAAAGRRPRRRR